MSLGYVQEKLFAALDVLVSAEPIQSRLHYAMVALHTLKLEDFPDNLRGRFQELWRDLTKVAPLHTDKGSIQLTAESLSDEAANKYAREILSLFFAVSQLDPRM